VIAAIIKAAPHVRIRFAPKRDMDSRLLREGLIVLAKSKGFITIPSGAGYSKTTSRRKIGPEKRASSDRCIAGEMPTSRY
jgi:hypothetical protein